MKINEQKTYRQNIIEGFFYYLASLYMDYGSKNISDLPVSCELKNKLSAFKCDTLVEIIERYSDADLLAKDMFINVLRFEPELLVREAMNKTNLSKIL